MPTEAIFDQLAAAKTSDEVKSILDGAKAKIVYSTETSASKGAGSGESSDNGEPVDPLADLAEDKADVAASEEPPKGENPFAKKGSGLKEAKKAAVDKQFPDGL